MLNELYARSGIHIRPENRGKFAAYADRQDETVQQAASRILGNKEEYPSYLVKRANFARNAAGWQKGQNGMIAGYPPDDQPIQPYGYNPYSTATLFGTRPILSKGALEVSQQTLDDETPNRNYLSTSPLQGISTSNRDIAFATPMHIPPYKYAGSQFGIPYSKTAAQAVAKQQQPQPEPPVYAGSQFGVPYSKTATQAVQQQQQAYVNKLQQQLMTAQQITPPVPQTEDVPHVMDRNEPEITPQTEEEQKKSNSQVPAYFDLIKTVDMGALLRNMVQGPPPSVQTPLTHYQRIKYDRGLLDTSRQQMQESSNRAMYEARQQLGQAGDIQNLMLGVNAQNQQAMAQLGQQGREMDMQERLANQQIQAQEEQVQDQQVQQETTLNYQIQQQAQMAKDQAVSTQLSNIKKDIREQTQYEIMKEAVDKQDARDEAYRKAQEQIGMAGTQLTLESMYQSLPQYQEGLKKKRSETMSTLGTSVMDSLRGEADYSSIIPKDAVFSEQITADLLNLPEDVRYAQETVEAYNTDLQQQEQRVKDYEAAIAEETDDNKRIELQNDLSYAQSKLTESRSNVEKSQGYYKGLSDEMKWKQEAQKRFNADWDRTGIATEYDKTFRDTSPLFRTIANLQQYIGTK